MKKMKKQITKDAWNLSDTDQMHPGFSVDCVLLCYHKKTVRILLTEFRIKDYWALPGGFMYNHENAEQAAMRVLEARTGVNNISLTQFYLFSDPNRTVIDQNKEFVDTNKEGKDVEEWLLKRFVSLGFYSFVKYNDVTLPKKGKEVVKWYDIDNLPKLYSDHSNIIQTALTMMPSMMPMASIAYSLLPDKFTMTELRMIYEKFLCKEFDRRNFQRKILSEDLVIQLDEKEKTNAYNPPFLYSFDKEKIKGMQQSYG